MNIQKFYTGKAIGFIIVLVLFVAGYFLFKHSDTSTVDNTTTEEQVAEVEPIKIEKKDIQEDNFTGTEPVITGDGALAKKAADYVKATIAEFKKNADLEVPDMREKFGADAPMASYTLDIDAQYLPGEKTESIVVSVYAYTGGANGNSSFRAFTIDKVSGKILSLSDVIMKEKTIIFTDEVKKELLAWRPEGSEGVVVFPEDVNNLTFDSFQDWSLDDKNLTLYFDKYEIGPGALGAILFPIPLEKIQSILSIR